MDNHIAMLWEKNMQIIFACLAEDHQSPSFKAWTSYLNIWVTMWSDFENFHHEFRGICSILTFHQNLGWNLSWHPGTSYNWTCMEGLVNLQCIVLLEFQHFSTYSHVLLLPDAGIQILSKFYIRSNMISCIYSYSILIYFPAGHRHYAVYSIPLYILPDFVRNSRNVYIIYSFHSNLCRSGTHSV